MKPIMQESELLQLVWHIAGIANESTEGVQNLTNKI